MHKKINHYDAIKMPLCRSFSRPLAVFDVTGFHPLYDPPSPIRPYRDGVPRPDLTNTLGKAKPYTE